MPRAPRSLALIVACLCAWPLAAAAEESSPGVTPTLIRATYQFNTFKDEQGNCIDVPGPAFEVSHPVSERLRVEIQYSRARGSTNGITADISNLEPGVAYRLDEPAPDGAGNHDPFGNLHVVASWGVFDGLVTPPVGVATTVHDEGLGLGLERLPETDQAVTYHYRLMLYPSVGASTNSVGQKAHLARVGVQVRLAEGFGLDVGYRYAAHKHKGEPATQTFEQGPFLSVVGSF